MTISDSQKNTELLVAGVDLGGTAVNTTLLDSAGTFLISNLCEHPARSLEGPAICLQQIVDGLQKAVAEAGRTHEEIAAIGLDTPGPATADGVLSSRGSTNFVHSDWAGFDIRGGLEKKLGVPVHYLNDGNAAAVWGHTTIFGNQPNKTSVSAIIGTGLGGGIIHKGTVVAGSRGFGGELGHVLIPTESITAMLPELAGVKAPCNCGRDGCLESLCSLTAIRKNLLPHYLQRYSDHPLASLDPAKAAVQVRGLAASGDDMCQEIFRVQARALGLFFDQMINVFDPDTLIIGGGAIETEEAFQKWFINEVRQGMPSQREEQLSIAIEIMPNGDTAGARGAAIEAQRALLPKQ
ncbi:MAG TPA: sugar kinase [Planctomycetaceae bacterium]|nr:sugar kinase [Planctomycetaceae bacterium]